MTTPDTLEAVRACVAEVCGVPVSEVSEDGKLLSYGMDSIRALDLVVALEERLGVELNEADPRFAMVETVRQLAEFVSGERDSGEPR